MIIKRLELHNFGVYAGTNIFDFQGNKPVVLIGGLNGRGKTTFLEAVLLSLYGSNSFAYNESKEKTYGQYLKSYVNRNDGTFQAYIEMVFILDTSKTEEYKIRREWTAGGFRTAETVTVYKDNEYNEFLTDNWTMFIENILPSGLSNFFFFDGEKIAEIAMDNTSKQIKEAIKALLGITVLDLLESDIGRIISRIARNNTDTSELQEIERLRVAKDEAAMDLEEIDKQIDVAMAEKREHVATLNKLQQEYKAKGGDIIFQRQELFNKRNQILVRLEQEQEVLLTDAASELPLVMLKPLLFKVREAAEEEHDKKVIVSATKKMESVLEKYKVDVEADRKIIENFIEFFRQQANKTNCRDKIGLPDTALFQLQVLLDERLTKVKLDTLSHQEKVQKCIAELAQIDSYLAVDVDEKAVAQTYKKIKKEEHSIADMEAKIELLQERRKTANGIVIQSNLEFNRKADTYLRKVEISDDASRVVKYSRIANLILDEYKVRLQREKAKSVAETMTKCYKKLANKKNLISMVNMNPDTLDITYLDDKGMEIRKDSLSAGEKQLMVISMLWALAICSKKKLPVIIDTPLSRLDSAHREALINVYFPQASEQTIILSTDSEIDRTYYNMLKKEISDEFTLSYDESTKSTSIIRGYFDELEVRK